MGHRYIQWLRVRRDIYSVPQDFALGREGTEVAEGLKFGGGGSTKGQIISECPYELIVYPKIATKKFPRFLPWPLRRGHIKNFIKPIMLNNP